MSTKNENNRLSMRTKLAFSMGDIYAGGCYNVISFFYLFFLTDVVGISPAWAGIMMAVGKVWDAVTDPFMGTISDRTKSRMGRRRPYFIWGVPLIILSFSMMWFPFDTDNQTIKILFFTLAFMFCYTITTMVQVPFMAMRAELTTDYKERNSLTAIEMTFSLLSTLVCASVPAFIYSAFDDLKKGYFVMGIVFSLFFGLPYLITFFGVKEREEFRNTVSRDEEHIFSQMLTSLKIKTFRHMNWMYLGVFITMNVVSTVFSYYMTYILGRSGELSLVLGTLLIFEIITIPLSTGMCNRLGKAKAIAFGGVLLIIGSLLTFPVGGMDSTMAIYILSAYIGFSFSFALIGVVSIFGESTDAYELQTGHRAEGLLSGVQQLLYKLASAAASLMIGWILELSGYVEKLAPGASQPESALLGIKCLMSIPGVLLFIFTVYFAMKWTLTPERHGKLISYLDMRRSGKKPDAALEAEVQKMKEIL